MSTQQCSLHRQTLAVERPYRCAQWLSTWHRHRMPPFQQVSSSNICPAICPTVSAVIVKWKCVGATTAQPWSVRPKRLTERDHQVLKHLAHINGLSTVATLTTKFQTASGSIVSTNTICWETMGFHGRAAAHKPKITMCNDSGAVETCSLQWWITLHHLAVRGTNLGLVDDRRMLPDTMHSANCKVLWRRNSGLGLFFMVRARPMVRAREILTLQHKLTF